MEQTAEKKPSWLISYHPDQTPGRSNIAAGFKRAIVDSVQRLTKCATMFSWSANVWKNNYRNAENFESSSWFVLDFDDPETNLEWAKKNFCDCIHFIGTTRSHQKEKHNVICDRFRVAIPWTTPITSTLDYFYSMETIGSKYDCDTACYEPARYFFPCTEIISISETGYTMDPLKAPDGYSLFNLSPEDYEKLIQFQTAQFKGIEYLQRHHRLFLLKGIPYGQGRQQSCHYTAMALLERGLGFEEVVELIRNAPFDRGIFKEAELIQGVKSAAKIVARRLNGNVRPIRKEE